MQFNSLRFRLLVPLLIATVPAVGLAVYANFEMRKDDVASAYSEATRVTRIVVRDHDLMLLETRRLLETLAAEPALIAMQEPACSTFLKRWQVVHPRYANLGVDNLAGDLRCSAIPFDAPVSMTDRLYFQDSLARDGFAVGRYQIGRVTGKPTVNAATPVRDTSGTTVGVVFAALDMQIMADVIADIGLPAGAVFTVADREGLILARYPDGDNWVGRNMLDAPVVQAMLTPTGERTARAPGLDGVDRLFALAPLTSSNGAVSIAVGYARAATLERANILLLAQLTVLALVVVSALSLAWTSTSRLVLQPVERITGAARNLGAGNLAARAGSNAPGEIGQLAGAFDSMASYVEGEVNRRTEELTKANTRLRELDELKDKFVSDVTHELRTPIANLRFFLALLRRGNPEKREHYMRMLDDQEERLEHLIDGILDLSRLSAGDPAETPPVAVNLNDVVARTLAGFEPRFSALGLRLQVDLDTSLPNVTGHKQQLRQVVANLVANALRYTPSGEVTVITARATGSCRSKSATPASASTQTTCRACSTASIAAARPWTARSPALA
jgi:signal transduction histidine kinase